MSNIFENLSLTNKCAVPLRNYIGFEGLTFEDGAKIAKAAGTLTAYWYVGLAVTLSLGILGYRLFGSKDKNKDGKEEREVVAPLWFILLPLVVGGIVALNEQRYKINQWKVENSSLKTMNVSKTDFINFKVQDDRQLRSSIISLVGTFVVASSGLLNPFFRGI